MLALTRALAALRVATPARIQLAPRVVSYARPFSFTVRALGPAKAALKVAKTPRTKTAASTTRAASKSKSKSKPKPKATPKAKPKTVAKGGRPKKVVKPAKAAPLPKVPKRAPSPYIVFAKEQFTELWRTIPPEMPFKERLRYIGKTAGATWNALSDAEKQPYIDRWRDLYDEAEAHILEWKRSLPPGELARLNKARKSKGKRAIKAPKVAGEIRRTSAFLLYLEDGRPIPGNFDHALSGRERQQEFVRKMADKWKTLSVTEKASYTDRAKKHNAAVLVSHAV